MKLRTNMGASWVAALSPITDPEALKRMDVKPV
jgi:hypothetical protein